jgi:hypothetical protein
MARKALALALALLPIVVVCNMQAQDVPASRWYPLKEGTQWHYRVVPTNNKPGKGNDDPAKKVVMRVVLREQVEFMRGDGKTHKMLAFRLEGTSEGQLVEHIAVSADGVYRILGDKIKLPPLRILKLPPANGDTWDVQLAGAKGTFTMDEAEITVPAQKKPFKTFHVKIEDIVVGAHKMSAEYWFAEDVGIVKQKIKWGTFSQVLELEKFEPPPAK